MNSGRWIVVPFKIESMLKVSCDSFRFVVEIYGRCIFNAQFLLAANSLVVMKLPFGLQTEFFFVHLDHLCMR